MTVSVNGTTGITFNDASTQNTAATGFGFKNRIINGAMMIDQRNAGASVTINSASNTYSLDRWVGAGQATDGVFTIQRSTTAPAGFINSLLATVTTSDSSIGSSQYYFIQQAIEGFNVADLGWGSANAQTVTLSFWVRSSLTGTFGGSLRNSSVNRSYPFSYVISSANTWEQKTVTIAGDTTGTWLTDNGIGVQVAWSLGDGSSRLGTAGSWAGANYTGATGQTNLIGTSGATFYITGVQLEKGSTATSFDYRPYGTEDMLCKRYYQLISGLTGTTGGSGGTYVYCSVNFPIEMRATPTAGQTGVLAFETPFGNASTQSSVFNTVISEATNNKGMYIYFRNFSGLSANLPLNKYNNTNALTLSAEL
jgi:hypothetical protein